MARANLEALIERLRTLTGAGDEFTDDELQAALDTTRVHRRYEPLYADDPETTDPTVFLHLAEAWEEGYELSDGNHVALTEATSGDISEPLIGRFVLSAPYSGTVYITGRTYDLYAAAAEVLTSWAAKVAKDFDFSADGQSFSRSQKRQGLLEMAAEYRRKAKPRFARLTRPDEEG